MSTISASSAAVHPSHKQRILDTLASQTKSGQISSTDQTALTSAVDDIDSALTSDSTSRSGASSTTQRLSPSDLKSRVDDLIANEVSNGTLTSDQATTLKSVFAQGGKGGGGQGGVGGPGGAGGPPPGPPPGGDGSSDDSTATTGTGTSASSTATTSGASDLLASFIKQLQSTQSQASAYSSSGSNGGSKLSSAILLNFEA